MSDPAVQLANTARAKPIERRPIGQMLIDAGLIDTSDLWNALDQQDHVAAPLGEILVAEGLVRETDILDALAFQHKAPRIDLEAQLPPRHLSKLLSWQLCIEFDLVPWREVSDTLWVATTRPDRLPRLAEKLGDAAPKLVPVISSKAQIQIAQTHLFGDVLAERAIARVPNTLSARNWGSTLSWRGLMALCWTLVIVLGSVLFPVWSTAFVLIFAVVTLALTLGLKVAAFLAFLRKPPDERVDDLQMPRRLPRVSVLVPLYREKRIASALIKRLSRLTYPKALLDVVLVLEAKDKITRDTIRNTSLPPWISVIEVPNDGTITTKPRALNYALDFCKGSIVGVWDAEDAPAPDQVERVVSRFHAAPPDVACLQGRLDYYNSKTNWISRCFTIEYATWWRIILPGLSRLGFVVPLGGTTLFFRRNVLDRLGAWDAHNVTEDADLGVRLAREGYQTELLPTVTREEANCRALPWVRQRSRWLKGFLITYLVHMRYPLRLLNDLGWWRFLGVQILFLATFAQFAAIPLLWSFWLPVAGIPHPVSTLFGFEILFWLGLFFITAEFLNIVIGMVAVSGPDHRHLLRWVLTMPLYFTMGAFAAYKALFEMIVTPFYWDKTEHGVAAD